MDHITTRARDLKLTVHVTDSHIMFDLNFYDYFTSVQSVHLNHLSIHASKKIFANGYFFLNLKTLNIPAVNRDIGPFAEKAT